MGAGSGDARSRSVEVLAICGRGLAGDAMEDPVELRKRLKAGREGGFADPLVGVKQELLDGFHARTR